jgi:hypothetical protein
MPLTRDASLLLPVSKNMYSHIVMAAKKNIMVAKKRMMVAKKRMMVAKKSIMVAKKSWSNWISQITTLIAPNQSLYSSPRTRN